MNFIYKKDKKKDLNIIKIFIDIETFIEGKRNEYMLCCITESGVRYTFENCKYFMDWVDENFQDNKYTVFIIAHNGSKFDFIYLLPYITNARLSGNIHDIKQMNFKNKYGVEIITNDFFLTISSSLSNIGKMFKSKNQKSDTTVMLSINNNEDVKNNYNELLEYCYQDCEVLKECFNLFKTNLESISYKDKQLIIPQYWISTADLANKIFKLNFLSIKVYGLCHEEYHEMKKSYYGGYTMVFKPKMENGYAYDINSSYPSIMLEPMPIINKEYPEMIEVDYNIDIKTLYWNNNNKIRYFHVTEYEFPVNIFMSLFPTRTKNGNFYYRKGKDIWIWDNMLQYIQDEPVFINTVIKIDKYMEFETSDIYKDYVTCFYERRLQFKKENNEIQCQISKILLNSLYGKTGQKEYLPTHICNHENLIEFITKYKHNINNITPISDSHVVIQNSKVNIDPDHMGALIYIASYITSTARLKLFKAIYSIINRGGQIYYCDTDSIYTNIQLDNEYISDIELGKWKLEYKVDKARFFGSKSYIIVKDNGEQLIKFKGIPKKYLPANNRLLNWEEDNYQEFFTEIETTWRRKFGYVENIPMKKIIRQTLNKRIYLDNNSFNL
jgi:hypothetical protein